MTQTRQDLLLLLAEVSKRYPEMRLGQMLSWFATASRGSIYDVEDEELIAAIREHLANPLARPEPINDSLLVESDC